jgi:hypothetical protein
MTPKWLFPGRDPLLPITPRQLHRGTIKQLAIRIDTS